jgi:translation initiation factor IF-3
MLGVMTAQKALQEAYKLKLDLIEVSPTANPPVCRITDFGKFKYEQEKKSQEARKKQKRVEIKEIKLRPNIAIGDYNIKLKKAEEFLKEGHKVRVAMQFRGREITHSEVGMNIIDRLKEALSEISKIEVHPKMEGRSIVMVLTAKN